MVIREKEIKRLVVVARIIINNVEADRFRAEVPCKRELRGRVGIIAAPNSAGLETNYLGGIMGESM